MTLYHIEEEGLLTVIQAQTALQATEHYARHHGWRLPQDALRLVGPGRWQVFGGQIVILEHVPSQVAQEQPGEKHP